jgi:hypothetical protein
MHPAFVWYWKQHRSDRNGPCSAAYMDWGPSAHQRRRRPGDDAELGLSGRHRGRNAEDDPVFGGGLGSRRPLRYLASRLDFSPEQLTATARLLEALKIERAQAAVDLRRAHADLAEALEGVEFGRESAQSARDRRLGAAERVQTAVTHTLEQLHALLDDEQREELATLIRSGSVRF